MKHKYSEMIKAKADNMDLVIIVKNCQYNGDWWALKSDKEILPSFSSGEYFACLPQHKEAVLRGLNGEIAESTNENREDWSESSVELWDKGWWYMSDNYVSRTRTKKEQRWVVVNPTGNSVNVNLMKTNPDISEYPDGCQAIEIEVEV